MNTKKNAVLVISVALLVALFLLLKPHQPVSAPYQPLPSTQPKYIATTSAQATQSASPSAQEVFNLVVKNNQLVSGPSTIQVNQGDTLTIRITADVDGELHLHGYDKHVDFTKNVPAQLTLQANISGRFPYELEDTKTEIGALEVMPR